MSDPTKELGREGERLAAEYLARAGYVILARNYRARSGELDLIAKEGDTLVFVEVKTRRAGAAVGPFEAVTRAKRRQMARVALDYLTRSGEGEQPARFDVVAVTFGKGEPFVELMKNAFGLDEG
ncbi:MAG: YraN family protein [Thermodesulfobacteriota bacterium]|jgi:putative endonuclease